jgi:flagellar assembly factor FliW
VIISTSRFGDITIDETRIIQMKGGILGFEHLKRYVLLTQDEKIPFWWLQSVDDGAIAFVVINSFVVDPVYAPVISDNDVRLLDIDSSEDVIPMSIVTIAADSLQITANMRAPVIINIKKQLATQIVLQDNEYPVQYSLTDSVRAMENDSVGATDTMADLKKVSTALAP